MANLMQRTFTGWNGKSVPMFYNKKKQSLNVDDVFDIKIVFRGLGKKAYPVTSSASRRLSDMFADSENDTLIDVFLWIDSGYC